MGSRNSSSWGAAPAVVRIEFSPGVWADVVTAPVSTVVEGSFEAAFEELIGAGSTASGEPEARRAAHEQVWRDLASETLVSEAVVSEAVIAEAVIAEAPSADALDVAGSDTADSDTTVSGDGVPEGLFAQLDLFDALVARITSVNPAALAGSVAAEVSHRVHAAVGRLEGQRLGCIGRVEAEGSWAAETMHGFISWLASTEGLSDGLAQRTVAAARALREHLPATALAVRAGTITGEHVATMVKATKTQVLCEALADAAPVETPEDAGDSTDDVVGRSWEENLLERSGWRLKEFNQLVKGFTIAADPVAQEKAFKDASEREFLQISPTLGGSQISGFVTTEHAQVLTTALRAVAGVPAADSLVPADLRRLDAWLDLSQMFLDGGIAGKGANVRPHLSVHITWDEFTRLYETATSHERAANAGASCDSGCGAHGEAIGTQTGHTSAGSTGTASTEGEGTCTCTCTDRGADSQDWSPYDLEARLAAGYATWEDGTGPIPDAVLRRISCDSEITRIIFGPDSQILNIGQTKRTFTKEHRRAIVARDRHCVWPGCDAPPHVCEVHHAIRHWADGGETTPSNGALLCRHHHHRVDGENIAMTYDNGWTIHTPGTYQAGNDAV